MKRVKHAVVCCLILLVWGTLEFSKHLTVTPAGEIASGLLEIVVPFAIIYLIILAAQLVPNWLPKADADGPKLR